jgi:thiol-disulfide isomerase/thioredoxin
MHSYRPPPGWLSAFRSKALEQWLTAEPDRQGKVVLIDFWATWCGPCRETIPELNEFQKEFKDDLLVIGVSDEQAKIVTDFMQNTKMEYPSAIDPAKRMDKATNVKGIPHVLVISTDAIVRWQGFPLRAEEDPEANHRRRSRRRGQAGEGDELEFLEFRLVPARPAT